MSSITKFRRDACVVCPYAETKKLNGVNQVTSACKCTKLNRPLITLITSEHAKCPLGRWDQPDVDIAATAAHSNQPQSKTDNHEQNKIKKRLKRGCGACKKAAELRKQRIMRND